MKSEPNPHDKAYHGLLQLVLDEGFHKPTRTGIDTIGVHGAQARFDLRQGFPLLTTKKMAFKALVAELLWFIAGDTNIRTLNSQGCRIWNGNAYDRYRKTAPQRYAYSGLEVLPEAEWLAKVMADPEFAEWRGISVRSTARSGATGPGPRARASTSLPIS